MRLALALALAFFAVPAAASASTVSVVLADSCAGDITCEKYGAGYPVPVTTFTAAPGEDNLVTVTQEGGELLIRDSGGPLTAAAPCRNVNMSNVRCPVTKGVPGVRGLAISLGDGDDTVALGGTKVGATIGAGPGDDAVVGGPEDDQIDGGPGDDLLAGGGGFDALVYSSRTAPVKVDLGSGGGGERGEADVVSGFEALRGGRAGDVLRGTGRADVIDGGPGPDSISGRGGDDVLTGGSGRDTISGGRGADWIFARGGGRDRVDCGPGHDHARTDRRDARCRCNP